MQLYVVLQQQSLDHDCPSTAHRAAVCCIAQRCNVQLQLPTLGTYVHSALVLIISTISAVVGRLATVQRVSGSFLARYHYLRDPLIGFPRQCVSACMWNML